MKLTWLSKLWTVAAVAVFSAASFAGEGAKPAMPNLGIGEAMPSKGLAKACEETKQTLQLNRFTDALNEHLLVAFGNTRKFKIIAGSDLMRVIDEQQKPKGLVVDVTHGGSQPGKIGGLDYLLITSLTDFGDAVEGMEIEGMRMRVDRRLIRASASVKIYNTTTGALIASVALPVSLDEAGARRVAGSTFSNRDAGDPMLDAAANQMARMAAMRIVDRLYPAKVIAVTDNQVTINRGEDTPIERDQVWEIYAMGPEMKDPDTGAVLGREEVKVGEMIITDVLPLFSKGVLRGNNTGVDVGAVARPKMAPPDRFGPGPGGGDQGIR